MHQQSQLNQVTEDTIRSARKKLMEKQFTINKALIYSNSAYVELIIFIIDS